MERQREWQANGGGERGTDEHRRDEIDRAPGVLERHQTHRRGQRHGEGDRHPVKVARFARGKKREPNIHSIPAIASPNAAQVRAAIGSRSTARASSAVTSGVMLLTIRMLAVVVVISASMNAIIMTAHIAPDKRP